VAGAATDESGLYAVALVRLDASGTIDQSFGVGGSQVVQLGLGTAMPGFVPGSYAVSVGARPGGGWLVTGQATASDNRIAMLVAAFHADGMLDFGFGSGGSIRPQPAGALPARTYGSRGAIVADGSSFVAGLIELNDGTSNRRAVIAKITAAGGIATGFGNMPTVGAYADTFDQAL
jgi:hypothetical protein